MFAWSLLKAYFEGTWDQRRPRLATIDRCGGGSLQFELDDSTRTIADLKEQIKQWSGLEPAHQAVFSLDDIGKCDERELADDARLSDRETQRFFLVLREEVAKDCEEVGWDSIEEEGLDKIERQDEADRPASRPTQGASDGIDDDGDVECCSERAPHARRSSVAQDEIVDEIEWSELEDVDESSKEAQLLLNFTCSTP